MADKKQGKPDGPSPATTPEGKQRSPAADLDPPTDPGGTRPPGPGPAAGSNTHGRSPAAPGGSPSPDPDAAKNAANQRAAHQAGALRDAVFPSLMASALGLDNLLESKAYRVYLERLIEDAGDPTDPIERMLVEQLALAHFRIGQLHVSAASAQGLEAVKVYNSVAARMLGEFRRTALALRVVQAGVPKAAKKVKLYKLAQ